MKVVAKMNCSPILVDGIELSQLKVKELRNLNIYLESKYYATGATLTDKKLELYGKISTFMYEMDLLHVNLSDEWKFNVTLLHMYDPKRIDDFENYTMSVKYDGFRAYYKNGSFFGRTNTIILAAQPLADLIFGGNFSTKIILDGELWFKEKSFEYTSSILSAEKPISNVALDKIRFKIFDVYNHDDKDLNYEERYSMILHFVDIINLKNVEAVIQYTIKSKKSLMNFYEKTLDGNGEGIVIRNKNAKYIQGRTFNVMKLKPLSRTVVQIVGYKGGQGKYAGLLGSFITSTELVDPHQVKEVKFSELKTNTKTNYLFISGISDEIRESYLTTHPIGATINISFNDTTKNGKPKHAVYNGLIH